MKVAIYLSGVPASKNEEKVAALKRFGRGVALNGDQVEYVVDHSVVKSDVAVIQGFVHRDVSSPHLKLRKAVLESNSRTIIIDSNLFQFASIDNPNQYLRYSMNGVFPTTGFYFNNKIDPSRWSAISSKLDLKLADYRTAGRHILLCLQRIDGWSMTDVDVQNWMHRTVTEIKRNTNRPILIRRHPGDKQQKKLMFPAGVSVSSSHTLAEDLRKAWATVTFNSSPGVASLIKGIPVFVTDPIPQRSQTWPICNTDLSKLDNPELFDRSEWIHNLSQSHWNNEEVESGMAWYFIRERIRLLESNPC